MEQQKIEQATDVVIDAITNSNLDNLTKMELLINMRAFFEDYNKNINLLNREKAKRNAMFCESDYDFCK